MGDVIHLRPIVAAVDQAKKFGTNATMAAIRRVREEQRAGRSGNAVAGELQRARLERQGWTRPFNPGPEAA